MGKRVKMEDMETDVERLRAHAKALEARNAQLVSENERLVAENDRLRSEAITKREPEEPSSPLVIGQPPESAAGTGLSSLGRWTTGLNGLSGNGLEVVVECNQSNKTPKKTANQEESPMADVVGKILKTEDFDFTDEQDTELASKSLIGSLNLHLRQNPQPPAPLQIMITPSLIQLGKRPLEICFQTWASARFEELLEFDSLRIYLLFSMFFMS